MVTSEGVADQGWYLDSGATHHLTNAVQNLTVGKSYSGSEMLLVGNGKGLSITHIGYTYFYTSLGTLLHLTDMLCVPHITKNLISVSKLLANNNVIIEFTSEFCFIKDKVKGTLLAQGIAEGGLYKLLSQNDLFSNSEVQVLKPNSMLSVVSNKIVNSCPESVKSVSVNSVSVNSMSFNNSPASFNTSSCISMQLLHNRLGHPHKHAMQIILKTQPSHIINHSLSFCDACQYGKLHHIHFPVTDIKTKSLLELIHTDLWGPASMSSKDGYKYYISFVDDFTRYSWIFPLTLESKALDTFKQYTLLVEK